MSAPAAQITHSTPPAQAHTHQESSCLAASSLNSRRFHERRPPIEWPPPFLSKTPRSMRSASAYFCGSGRDCLRCRSCCFCVSFRLPPCAPSSSLPLPLPLPAAGSCAIDSKLAKEGRCLRWWPASPIPPLSLSFAPGPVTLAVDPLTRRSGGTSPLAPPLRRSACAATSLSGTASV